MSAKLSEEDLNDYIAPGPICINPTNKDKGPGQSSVRELEVGTEPSEPEKVSISLQDCLACAGCITSSEEVLLSKQSHTVFLKAWKDMPSDKQLIISVAPQCRLSLAQYFSLPLAEMDRVLLSIFSNVLHCQYAVGTELGRAITIQHTNEQLLRLKNQGAKSPKLCSVCPGFVLYAEKTRPELVPLLLSIKSPQQVTSSLLKQTLPEQDFYHMALMPCFDKKLEASRPDAQEEGVDCVLTPREFLAILEELQVEVRDHLSADGHTLVNKLSPPGWDPRLHWASNEGSSSGGYAYQYARFIKELNPGSDVHVLQGRNGDVREYRVIASDNEQHVLASASELYGFRNIQNMVRRLRGSTRGVRVVRKRGAAQDDHTSISQSAKQADPYSSEFIEVMACPGGCINGGGLLSGESSTKRRSTAQALDERYAKELEMVDPLLLTLGSAAQRSYEYEFHAIEHKKSTNPVAMSGAW
ncbi:NAR1 (YNL240C) [Zygosaccharomyces parabailii]|uniref:Cytosolic Fe-S cluster assembly factor NAR1 n=1 Tax=Zygosaccharomyces bailii (strain CLIB 213 / ATCC 58445 / CBS 680 / BCRC 21525 / NBRC 1098 / NCYC 1416 / NRRL Y-2227) TaxID=1333698 RepID=A0A8J2T6C7_ZYGB2|nr:NAR1 (YNL240C) [Zygosaccharomyces parabailii]CDF89266.1 ZYBA0S04-00210g1_1 [Zygosaccharomyces bailii CLIB 213]CDH08224.1 related to Cytosolic Fe-S cluster assembly factor NAR1 [Zygosaccharomyces bailii ISA1307]